MFGTRKSKKSSPIEWPLIQALLEDDDQRAASERIFPEPCQESFLSALRRIHPSLAADVMALGRQVQHGERLAEYPTLAVAGMLNSGKTSLVASLLSEQGRQRTLRGLANRQGTHRFVLWLPAIWRNDADLWELLLSDFGDAVGHPPELLDESPEQAHLQYNNRGGGEDELGIPLVATDPQLDDLGIGLLDCPDIVSDAVFGVGTPERRRELLGKASTFCSAFLVVSTPSMARDRSLGEILQTVADLMPGIPRYLAVNKIRPSQQAEDILESFEPQTEKYGVESVYGAYDFEIKDSDSYIPKKVIDGDEEIELESDPNDPLPVFFSLDVRPESNPPAAISVARTLPHLANVLDAPESSSRFLIGRYTALRQMIWEKAMPEIGRDAEQSSAAAERAKKTMLRTTVELFTKRENGKIVDVRMHQSERIVHQLAQAFSDAAPWYARWGVKINMFIQSRTRAATDLLKQFAPSAIAENYANQIKEKFKSGSGETGKLIAPRDLAEQLLNCGAAQNLPHWFSRQGDVEHPDDWKAAMEDILGQFEKYDRVQFDGDELREVAENMWRQVSTGKKLTFGLTPLAAMLATFGSILMLPFDFGTSILANASIVELLAAAGLTAFSAYWAGGKNALALTNQAAAEQMSLFYVLLCRRLGVDPGEPLPTIELKQTQIKFPPPNLPSSSEISAEPFGKVLSVYRTRDVFRRELTKILPRQSS